MDNDNKLDFLGQVTEPGPLHGALQFRKGEKRPILSFIPRYFENLQMHHLCRPGSSSTPTWKSIDYLGPGIIYPPDYPDSCPFPFSNMDMAVISFRVMTGTFPPDHYSSADIWSFIEAYTKYPYIKFVGPDTSGKCKDAYVIGKGDKQWKVRLGTGGESFNVIIEQQQHWTVNLGTQGDSCDVISPSFDDKCFPFTESESLEIMDSLTYLYNYGRLPEKQYSFFGF